MVVFTNYLNGVQLSQPCTSVGCCYYV